MGESHSPPSVGESSHGNEKDLMELQPTLYCNRSGLLPVIDPMGKPPKFGKEEEVKLDPRIFKMACDQFTFRPVIDLFASDRHKQLETYYSVDVDDQLALGINAFNFQWTSEVDLYANPP